MATYDELHHFDGTSWNPQTQGVAPVSASQLVGGPATTPISPMSPSGTPPPSTRDAVVRMANDPDALSKYTPHQDSVHKATAMAQSGGFNKINYPTVTDREISEFSDNLRTNTAMVAAKAAQNHSLDFGTAIDFMQGAGAVDDSTAQAAKAALLAPKKTGR